LYQSFKDCVKFHLLTVFPLNAAENERYYLNVHLKNPARVLICHFVARILQINSYLGTLLGVYDSPMAIAKTKRITPFDEVDLTQLILKMCPMEWQNQYSLSQGIIPQDMGSLMDTLKIIKKGEMTKSPKRMFLERVKKLGKLREELLRRTQSAVYLLGKSTLQRKLAQRNSVTSVRNMEELIQPMILGIVRSLMWVELSKQDSNLGRSPTGMRTLLKS
jgi:hypothetical protein